MFRSIVGRFSIKISAKTGKKKRIFHPLFIAKQTHFHNQFKGFFRR
jgi:hypothetical protein|tara:strand:- start:337 stop:474 length:138 start_codon:yes stop_codon:yes gene_type:complete